MKKKSMFSGGINCSFIAICAVLISLYLTSCQPDPENLSADYPKIRNKAQQAEAFCRDRGFCRNFCILIDMSIHSGLNRFFIWDFPRDTIIHSCLVSHGCGRHSWSFDHSKEDPCFSNRDGSHCTALGKYRIGARGTSDWRIGIKYLMHGLERTNSNALARQIVFHSWSEVPGEEVYPDGTPEGWGCPAVSEKDMRRIDPMLRRAGGRVLMWIYR